MADRQTVQSVIDQIARERGLSPAAKQRLIELAISEGQQPTTTFMDRVRQAARNVGVVFTQKTLGDPDEWVGLESTGGPRGEITRGELEELGRRVSISHGTDMGPAGLEGSWLPRPQVVAPPPRNAGGSGEFVTDPRMAGELAFMRPQEAINWEGVDTQSVAAALPPRRLSRFPTQAGPADAIPPLIESVAPAFRPTFRAPDGYDMEDAGISSPLASAFASGTLADRNRTNAGTTEDLQTRLKSLGYYSGPIDGDWGRGTDRAVKAYQKDRGLRVDGVVGPETFGALNEDSNYLSTMPLPRARPEPPSRLSSTAGVLPFDAPYREPLMPIEDRRNWGPARNLLEAAIVGSGLTIKPGLEQSTETPVTGKNWRGEMSELSGRIEPPAVSSSPPWDAVAPGIGSPFGTRDPQVPGLAMPYAGTASSSDDLLGYTRQVASQLGIDPDVAAQVATWEGLRASGGAGNAFQSDVWFDANGRVVPKNDPRAVRREESYGLFQLNNRGVGRNFERDTGFSLTDPSIEAEKARIAYGLRAAAAGKSWGPWMAVKNNNKPNSWGLGNVKSQLPSYADLVTTQPAKPWYETYTGPIPIPSGPPGPQTVAAAPGAYRFHPDEFKTQVSLDPFGDGPVPQRPGLRPNIRDIGAIDPSAAALLEGLDITPPIPEPRPISPEELSRVRRGIGELPAGFGITPEQWEAHKRRQGTLTAEDRALQPLGMPTPRPNPAPNSVPAPPGVVTTDPVEQLARELDQMELNKTQEELSAYFGSPMTGLDSLVAAGPPLIEPDYATPGSPPSLSMGMPRKEWVEGPNGRMVERWTFPDSWRTGDNLDQRFAPPSAGKLAGMLGTGLFGVPAALEKYGQSVRDDLGGLFGGIGDLGASEMRQLNAGLADRPIAPERSGGFVMPNDDAETASFGYPLDPIQSLLPGFDMSMRPGPATVPQHPSSQNVNNWWDSNDFSTWPEERRVTTQPIEGKVVQSPLPGNAASTAVTPSSNGASRGLDITFTKSNNFMPGGFSWSQTAPSTAFSVAPPVESHYYRPEGYRPKGPATTQTAATPGPSYGGTIDYTPLGGTYPDYEDSFLDFFGGVPPTTPAALAGQPVPPAAMQAAAPAVAAKLPAVAQAVNILRGQPGGFSATMDRMVAADRLTPEFAINKSTGGRVLTSGTTPQARTPYSTGRTERGNHVVSYDMGNGTQTWIERDDGRYVRDDSASDTSGGTVLCTFFYRRGKLSHELWAADSEFSKSLPLPVRKGYWRWAIPAVRQLENGNSRLERVLWPIVNAWAHYAGWRMGVVKPFPIGGWVVHRVGSLLSRYSARRLRRLIQGYA